MNPSRQSTQRHRQALAAIRNGKDEAAVRFFDSACKLDPKNTSIQLDYARFLKCLFRFEDARDHVRKASLLLPDCPQVIHAAAGIAMECRMPDLALTLLRPITNDACCLFEQACVLERLGRLDEASEMISQSERLDGSNMETGLLRARILSRHGENARSLDILGKLLKKGPSDPWIKARIHYACGSSLDRLGEYSDAFRAWLAAKECMASFSNCLQPQTRAQTDAYAQCAEQVTPDILSGWKNETPRIDGAQPILVTGYPRSGTTLVEHVLTEETRIRSADENSAFRDLVWRKQGVADQSGEALWTGIQSIKPDRFEACLGDYRQALIELSGSSGDTSWVFDKNPELLSKLPVLLRMLPHLPVVRIQRDPRDVMISCFSQSFALNHFSTHFLSMETLARNLACSCAAADHMKSVMGEQMISLHYENLVSDPTTEKVKLERTLGDLCGLCLSEEADDAGRNEAGRVSYSPSNAAAATEIYTSAKGRWENYVKWLEPHLHCLEPHIDAFGDER